MKIDTARPSLWYCEQYNMLRILYPDGTVEILYSYGWKKSIFSGSDPEYIVTEFEELNMELVSYL